MIGGSKVHDVYLILKRWLELGKAEKVLMAGIPGILGLYAKGHSIGKSLSVLEEGHFLHEKDEIAELLQKFGDKIILPKDVAVDSGGTRVEVPVGEKLHGQIKDIGSQTIEHYSHEIGKAEVLIMNGSPGVYEETEFSEGTMKLLNSVASNAHFSLIGGGHTITAIEKFRIPKEKFGYISLAGKAFLHHLEGKKLPAIEALEHNSKLVF